MSTFGKEITVDEAITMCKGDPTLTEFITKGLKIRKNSGGVGFTIFGIGSCWDRHIVWNPNFTPATCVAGNGNLDGFTLEDVNPYHGSRVKQVRDWC